jgi:hypothetical protein
MGVYNLAHAIYTTTAHFDIVPVEYFLENVLFWKMFVNQMKELSAYIGCHLLRRKRINQIILWLRLWVALVESLCLGVKHEGVIMPGTFECLLRW